MRSDIEVTGTFGVRWRDDIWVIAFVSPQEVGHVTGIWVTDTNPLREPDLTERPTILPLTEDADHFTDVMQIGDYERLREVFEVAGEEQAVPFADACGRQPD